MQSHRSQGSEVKRSVDDCNGLWVQDCQYILSFLRFFFSSRRRHTRFKCDWSSDVCSSDLRVGSVEPLATASLWPLWTRGPTCAPLGKPWTKPRPTTSSRLPTVQPIQLLARGIPTTHRTTRSEERRVGKECRSRWSPYQ